MWAVEERSIEHGTVPRMKERGRNGDLKCRRPQAHTVRWWEVFRPDAPSHSFVCYSAEDAAWLSSVLAEYEA